MFLIFITFSGQGGLGGLRPIWVWLFPLTSDHPLDSHKLFDNDDDDENYDDDVDGDVFGDDDGDNVDKPGQETRRYTHQ